MKILVQKGDATDAAEQLANLNGETISVFAGKDPMERKNFNTAMCINGKLEQHPEDKGKFRVLVSEGTYTYFSPEDVEAIFIRKERFKDGSIAVISISI